MGYLHDVPLSRFVSPFECVYYGTGTWTPTIAANLVTIVRSAAANWCRIVIPLVVLSNSAAKTGVYLKSVDTYYKIATEAYQLVNGLAIDKMTLAADGTACTGVTVAVTQDAGNDTNAERVTIDDHTMTTTITTPVWVDNGEHFYGMLNLLPSGNGVFSFIGARVNYTLRI